MSNDVDVAGNIIVPWSLIGGSLPALTKRLHILWNYFYLTTFKIWYSLDTDWLRITFL